MVVRRSSPLGDTAAFTLIELAIVIVIIGLLVGGIMAGQSLIRATGMRTATAEFLKYQNAIGVFKDKYSALPGDMASAVRYWGAAAGGTADGYDLTCLALTTQSTDKTTCNGNGNGTIDGTYEFLRAWQHLANAGLIAGQYGGVSGPMGSVDSRLDVNVPSSKLKPAGWSFASGGWVGYPIFDANYGNSLVFGTLFPGKMTSQPIFRPEDAYGIDAKIDDGVPSTGKVLTFKNDAQPDCLTVDQSAYALDNSNVTCALIFITGY